MLKQSWGRVRESGGDRQVNLWGMGKDQTIPKNVTRHTIGGSYNTAYPNWLQSWSTLPIGIGCSFASDRVFADRPLSRYSCTRSENDHASIQDCQRDFTISEKLSFGHPSFVTELFLAHHDTSVFQWPTKQVPLDSSDRM